MKNLQKFTHEGNECLEFNSGRDYGGPDGQKIRAMVLSIEKMAGWGDMAPQTIQFALIDETRGMAMKHYIVDNDAHGVGYVFTPDKIMDVYDRVDHQDDLTTREERAINTLFDDRQKRINAIEQNFNTYSELEPEMRVKKMIGLLTELDGPIEDYQKLRVTRTVTRACEKALTPPRELQTWNNIAKSIDRSEPVEQPEPTEPVMANSEHFEPSRPSR
jgi:hypothetical protein